MRLGFTYDLKDDYLAAGLSPEQAAEFDSVDTIDAIDDALRSLGHDVDRIGRIESLVQRLARGDRWDLVFNIAEGVRGFGRESAVPALLDQYDIPSTFSDPLACAVTLHKPSAKRILRDAGVPTCDFAVVEREQDAARVDLTFPVFAKPSAEGTSKGIGPDAKITNAAALKDVCARLLREHNQPVLVERYLPGREFTVGVLGTGPNARAVACLEIEMVRGRADSLDVYTYLNKEEYDTHVRYFLAHDDLAQRANDVALQAWRTLGCRDGGRVDLRCDEHGAPQVMEINPLPGLHPVRSDLPIMWSQLGRDYNDLIAAILESAAERVRTTPTRRETQPCAS